MTRFPRSVYDDGQEPDPRFSLANERTFLAWLRTALAMYAGAFAIEALPISAGPGWRLAAAAIFLVAGTLAALHAWFGWAHTEKALRHARPLPGLAVGAILGSAAVLAVVLLVLGMIV